MKYLTSLFTHLLIKPCNEFDQQSLFSRANLESMKEFVITEELSLFFLKCTFCARAWCLVEKLARYPASLLKLISVIPYISVIITPERCNT